MTSTSQREHTLQKQIVEALRWNGIITIDTDLMSGLMFLGEDIGKRYAFINHHKAMGWSKGTPDLILVLRGGEVLFVELKDGNNNNPTFEQQAFMASLQRLGHTGVVWRTLDDCRDFIKGYKNCIAREVKDGKLNPDDYQRAFGIETTATSQKQKVSGSGDNKQQSPVAGED